LEDGQGYPSLPHPLGGQHTLLKSPFGGGRAGRVKRKNAKKGGDDTEKRKISLYIKCIRNLGERAGRVKRKNAKKGRR